MSILLQLYRFGEFQGNRKINSDHPFNVSVIQQAEDTGGLLNKIEKKDNDEPFNFLMREFSLQILHEPIVLSANGFFTVNLDLLGSVKMMDRTERK